MRPVFGGGTAGVPGWTFAYAALSGKM